MNTEGETRLKTSCGVSVVGFGSILCDDKPSGKRQQSATVSMHSLGGMSSKDRNGVGPLSSAPAQVAVMPQVEDKQGPQLLAVVDPARQVVVDKPRHRRGFEESLADDPLR